MSPVRRSSNRRHRIVPRYDLQPDDDLYSAASRPPMSQEEERELFARRQSATDQERARIDDQVIRAHIRWATIEAARAGSDLPLSVLRSAGVRGVHQALLRYDVQRGVRFLSYAVWWIRQAIHEEIRAQWPAPLRLPDSVMPNRQELVKASRAAPTATLDQLLEDIEVRGDERAALVMSMAGHCRLDAPTPQSGGKRTYLDSLAAPEPHEEPCWCDHLADPRSTIVAALAGLPDGMRQVIVMRFGLAGGEPMDMPAIAARLRLSRQRIHQLKDAGLARLRKAMLATGSDELREAVRAASPEAN